MTVTISGTTGIDKVAPGAVETADLPAGTVLQVVNATNTTSVSTTSTAYSSTGTTATITPTSASSKILVVFSQELFLTIAASTSKLNLYRGASSIKTFEYTGYAGSSTLMIYPTCQFLDSPATTSATTYTVYFNSANGSSNIIANYTDGSGAPTSTITLMEIAA